MKADLPKPPALQMKLALRCPMCNVGNLVAMRSIPQLVCPNCGYMRPKDEGERTKRSER